MQKRSFEKIYNILCEIDCRFKESNPVIHRQKRQEDGTFYNVWTIDTQTNKYVLKKTEEREAKTYNDFADSLKLCAPELYAVKSINGETYILTEYIDGTDLCKCNRIALKSCLDTLIRVQKATWGNDSIYGYTFSESLEDRKRRGTYLNDSTLEKAYSEFLKKYQTVPLAFCHDDFLPFNTLISRTNGKAYFIDLAYAGILPYPVSFARLIAHCENDENALFFMSDSDKTFAIDYYYENLLKDKNISRDEWLNTLDYFLFFEYCEWVAIGNKYGKDESKYFYKYLPVAKRQAEKILKKQSI